MSRRGWAGVIVVLFVILSQAFGYPNPVLADMVPPAPPVGSDLFPPVETTNVRMVKEAVLLDISSDSTHPNGTANVTAEFQMRNMGDSVETMQARFPLGLDYEWFLSHYRQFDKCFTAFAGFPSIENFSVTINGTQEETTTTTATNIEGTPIQHIRAGRISGLPFHRM